MGSKEVIGVANGVKQGGVICLIIFSIYMDKLSIALNNSGIGGYLQMFFKIICVMLMIYVLLVYHPLECSNY